MISADRFQFFILELFKAENCVLMCWCCLLSYLDETKQGQKQKLGPLQFEAVFAERLPWEKTHGNSFSSNLTSIESRVGITQSPMSDYQHSM